MAKGDLAPEKEAPAPGPDCGWWFNPKGDDFAPEKEAPAPELDCGWDGWMPCRSVSAREPRLGGSWPPWKRWANSISACEGQGLRVRVNPGLGLRIRGNL